MKYYLVPVLLFTIGCFNIQVEPTEHKGVEVIFCEISDDYYPNFEKNKEIEKDMGVKVDYRTIENQKGVHFGRGMNPITKDMYWVYHLTNGERIFIKDNHIYSSDEFEEMIGPKFVVKVDKYEKLKDHIGKTVWLNRKYDYDKDKIGKYLVSYDGSSINRFEKVIITSVKTYYDGNEFRDGLWLEFELEDGRKGLLKYVEDDPYYSENPLKEEWGEEIIDLIKNKKIRIGMTKEQVMLSWGKTPWNISRSVSVLGRTERWEYRLTGYSREYVTFHNNKVVSIDQY